LHVPYKGGGPAITELLGGQVARTSAPSRALPHIKAGKLRALGVTGAKRSSRGTRGRDHCRSGRCTLYAVDGWYAIGNAAANAAAYHHTLRDHPASRLQASDVKQRLASQGIEAAMSTPDEMRKIIYSRPREVGESVVRDCGIQPE
jgi:tripartite-type tricarboxylate transporter receptor subunit TctC